MAVFGHDVRHAKAVLVARFIVSVFEVGKFRPCFEFPVSVVADFYRARVGVKKIISFAADFFVVWNVLKVFARAVCRDERFRRELRARSSVQNRRVVLVIPFGIKVTVEIGQNVFKLNVVYRGIEIADFHVCDSVQHAARAKRHAEKILHFGDGHFVEFQ